MTDMNRPDSSNLDAYLLTTGTQVIANRVATGGDPKVLGCTLLANSIYVFPLGTHKSPVPAETPYVSAQVWWSAATTITAITVETCLYPSTEQAQDLRGPAIISDFDSTAGFWLQQNPPTGYVPTTGGVPTAFSVAPTALTQGGCEFDISAWGGRRARIKVQVGATGGVVRCGVHGKSGS